MSRFIRIDEQDARPFQASSLLQIDVQRVALVVLVIERHFLAQDDWIRELQKGSVTLKRENHPGQVVKIFVDYGNKLADKCGLRIHPDPIVIGLELTGQPAIVRDCIRDGIAKMFRFYIDPRKDDCHKWWMQPVEGHKYDILFLEQGPCEFDVDGRDYEELIMELGQGISL